MPMTLTTNELLHYANRNVILNNGYTATGVDEWTLTPAAERAIIEFEEAERRRTRRLVDEVDDSPFGEMPMTASFDTLTWGRVAAEVSRPRPHLRSSFTFSDNENDVESMPEPDYDFDEDSDSDYEERKSWRSLGEEDMPAYNLPKWPNLTERERVVELYFKHVEYRLNWIFLRIEREGFTRRQVNPFNRNDFMEKVGKLSKPHDLNTEASMFYDWNFGATDFILRLENFEVDGIDCMRCHFIYKPNGLEVGYQDRVWNGENYSEINMEWAQVE